MNNLIYENYPLICQNILEYLTIEELFKLSLVNKKFNLIVKQFKIRELSLFHIFSIPNKQFGSYCCKGNYEFINKLKNYNYLIYFKDREKRVQSILNSSSFNFKNLRILQLKLYPESGLDLNLVNKFIELEYLRIRTDDRYIPNFKISLPNLIALVLSIHLPYIIKIQLDNMPKLKYLGLKHSHHWKENELLIENPLTIEYLKIDNYNRIEGIISSFKNIKTIHMRYWYSNIDLNQFPKLEKMIIDDKLEDYRFNSGRILNDEDMEMIFEKINSCKNIIEFYFKNIRISNKNQLINIQNNYNQSKEDKKLFNFCIENYELIDINSKLLKEINYNELISLFNNQIPIDFFDKFNKIITIKIDKSINDVNKLIKFIFNCKNLCQLFFNNTSLKSDFYNQLPSLTSLIRLEIIEDNNEIKFDFDFVKKFHHLEILHVDREIDIDLIYAFNRLRYFSLAFQLNGTKFLIEKINKFKFHFFSDDTLIDKTYIKLDEVFEIFHDVKTNKTIDLAKTKYLKLEKIRGLLPIPRPCYDNIVRSPWKFRSYREYA